MVAKGKKSGGARTRGVRSDLLGEMAHKRVASWLADECVSTNSSERDRGAWDLFAQLPNEGQRTLLFPHGAPELACLLQVKAVDGKGYFQDRLSNLKRLVEHPLPTFYVLLDYRGGKAPVSVHLIHVGEATIERVLKRLETLDGIVEANLNKRTMRMTEADGEQIVRPFSASLVTAIRRVIGQQVEYTKWKARLIEEVGFADRRDAMRVDLAGDDVGAKARALVDWAIGLTPTLQIARLEISRTRFGVKKVVSDTEDASVGGTLTVHSNKTGKHPSSDGVVCHVRTSDSEEEATVTGELMFSESIAPQIPREYHKRRFIASGVDLVMPVGGERGTMVANLPAYEERLRLAELLALGRFRRLLAGKPPLQVEFSRDGEHLFGCTLEGSLALSEWEMQATTLLDELWEMSGLLEVNLDEQVSVSDVWAVRDMIQRLHVTMGHHGQSLRVSSRVVSPDHGLLLLAEKAALVMLHGFKLGTCVYAVVVAYAGRITRREPEGDGLRVSLDEAQPVKLSAHKRRAETWNEETARNAMELATLEAEKRWPDHLIVT